MAVTTKHKKARMFRDFLIETEGMNMFKEEENEKVIFFRSVYPFPNEERKQFMLIIDDSVYLTMQALIVQDVPEAKRDEMIKLINQLQFEYPTMKYVLTPDGQVMTSTVFHAHENNLDPKMVIRCTVEIMKVIATQHYDRFKQVLEA
ncbi:MAG: hypothetical protein ACRDDX_09560 [Cellulosilyticaceae bacterium]